MVTVIAVFKSSCKTDIKSFRLVTIISAFSPVFEIGIYNKVSNFDRSKIVAEQRDIVKGWFTVLNLFFLQRIRLKP